MTNLGELRAAFEDWLARTDLSARIPDFLRLVTAEIQRRIKPQDDEVSIVLSLANGTSVLPADFNGVKVVHTDQDRGYPIPSMNENYAERVYVAENQTVWPVGYVIRRGEIEIIPGGDTGTVTLVYYKKLSDLEADADTNAVLTDHPDVYLYGALMHAANFIQDMQRQSTFAAMYEGAFRALAKDVQFKRYGSDPLTRRP